jgi:hypothetical protein
MRMTISAALVALALPVTAMAQTADERIDAAMARVAAAGIPVSLLDEKIAEGRAKGIPMDRIAAAVEQRAAGLARAQQALSGINDVDAADLSAAANALEGGVSAAVLQAISEVAPRERRAVAIAALEYLVGEGIAPEQALAQVKTALQRGPDALANRPQAAGAGSVPGSVPAGPPSGVPTPGQAPQGGRPAGVGRP